MAKTVRRRRFRRRGRAEVSFSGVGVAGRCCFLLVCCCPDIRPGHHDEVRIQRGIVTPARCASGVLPWTIRRDTRIQSESRVDCGAKCCRL